MLKFESSFFHKEERCGFVVSEKMKHAWAAELEVLANILSICYKYNITYYADWGTLLGAVRHQGYIPWDDDIDIALKRADYLKLLEALKRELPKHYKISSIYTSEDHNQPLSCVMNSRIILTDENMIKEFHGCPYIVGVDIFPLDYISRDEEDASLQRAMYSAVYDMAKRYPIFEQNGELEMYLSHIEEMCNIKFRHDLPIRRQLWLLSDKICSLYSEDESDYITYFPRVVCSDANYKLKKDWYENIKEIPFENIMISVPAKYHEVLTVMYGDYMKPDMLEGRAHEYPFYKKQEEILEKMKQTRR